MMLPRDWSRSFDHIKNKTAFYIHDIAQWSDVEPADLDLWLTNFPDDEGRYTAIQLVNRFIYYSEKDVKLLLEHGLFKMSLYNPALTWTRGKMFATTSVEQETFAKQFIAGTTFAPLLDRNKPSESGNVLCRYLNRDLNVSSTQICQPAEIASFTNRRVIVVDDFIGSGQQIIDFWTLPKIGGKSLARIAATNNLEITYLSLVATRYGLDRVSRFTSGLNVITCEILEDSYRIFAVPSLYFGRGDQVAAAKQYLSKLCKTRNIQLLGFHKLDFAIAFHHSIPDATLPLFYKNTNQWKPLIKRRQG